jgi:hypothetical protein
VNEKQSLPTMTDEELVAVGEKLFDEWQGSPEWLDPMPGRLAEVLAELRRRSPPQELSDAIEAVLDVEQAEGMVASLLAGGEGAGADMLQAFAALRRGPHDE